MQIRTTAAAVTALAAMTVAACGESGSETPRQQPTAASSATPAPSVGPSPAVSPSPTPADDVLVIRVVVRGGEVTRESRRVDVKRGEKVRIEVTSDVADEIHLHTYDVKIDVAAGVPATLEFEATIPGQFDVELEKSHLLLVVIAVR